MQKPLTHHDVLELQDVVRIGDLLLLPRARLPNLSESFAMQKAGVIDVSTSEIARNQLWYDLIDMEKAYCAWRNSEQGEPGWMENVPIATRRYLREWYARTEEDPLDIVPNFPHTGVSYMFVRGGLAEEIEQLFRLFRLSRINQLGFLQAPWVAMSDWPLVERLTHISRHVHSRDVTALGMVMARNLDLSEQDLHTQEIACLTHDWGMPAGGDSVKLIALDAFDEDRNYRSLFKKRINKKQWRGICERYDVKEEKLFGTILNEGLLGQILDVADKVAYVARDIDVCLNVAVDLRAVGLDDDDAYVGTRALKEIVDEYPHVCSVWDAVRRDGDRLVFTNVPHLIAFLKTRIVLFRELYYHPRARFGEYLMSRCLVKKLYDRKVLTRDMLLEMDDSDLTRVLEAEYGSQNLIRTLSLKSKVQSFKTRAEALEFEADLKQQEVSFSLVEDHLHAIKSGTHFLVDSPKGISPLLQAYPGDARELYEMANMLPAVHVYYVADSELPASERQEVLQLLT